MELPADASLSWHVLRGQPMLASRGLDVGCQGLPGVMAAGSRSTARPEECPRDEGLVPLVGCGMGAEPSLGLVRAADSVCAPLGVTLRLKIAPDLLRAAR